jgi:hypothetical protein
VRQFPDVASVLGYGQLSGSEFTLKNSGVRTCTIVGYPQLSVSNGYGIDSEIADINGLPWYHSKSTINTLKHDEAALILIVYPKAAYSLAASSACNLGTTLYFAFNKIVGKILVRRSKLIRLIANALLCSTYAMVSPIVPQGDSDTLLPTVMARKSLKLGKVMTMKNGVPTQISVGTIIASGTSVGAGVCDFNQPVSVGGEVGIRSQEVPPDISVAINAQCQAYVESIGPTVSMPLTAPSRIQSTISPPTSISPSHN